MPRNIVSVLVIMGLGILGVAIAKKIPMLQDHV